MTGKQLKNSILQWAIQGKLVPQNPNDEPASVLLERIRAEKARLVKEGKIKKDKNESIIFRGEDNSYYEKFADGKVVCIDEEIPFIVPSSWEWCRLGSVSSIYGGKRIPAGRKLSTSDTGHKYIRVSDMKNSSVLLDDIHYVTEDIFQLIKAYTISKDDLYITVAGTIGSVGEIPEELDNANLTENADKIVFSIIDKRFLMYALQSELVQSQIKECTTQVGQPKLAIMRIQGIIIALPPLNEQKRIVDAIENVIPSISKYEQAQIALEKLNTCLNEKFRKSVLQEAIQGKLVPQDASDEPASVLLQRIKEEKLHLVKEGKLKEKDVNDSTIFRGDDNKYYEQTGSEITCIDDIIPFDLPASWCWVRHNQLFEVSGGSQPPKSHFIDHYKEGYIRLYQIRDYGSNPVPVYVPINEISKTTKKGDILLARYGGSLGKVFWAEEGAYNVAMAKVIPLYKSGSIFNEYIFLYYCSSIYQSTIIDHSRSAQAGFNKDDLADMLFPLPPFAEQVRIVERYKSIVASIMSR